MYNNKGKEVRIMRIKIFLSVVLVILFLSGCNAESNATNSRDDVISAKEAESLLNEIGDAPAFTDDIFGNKEEILNRLIELQDWTIRVITLDRNYYQQKDSEAIDLVTSKLLGTYSLDISNYYINKYYKKEENGLWSYLEQEGIGLLKIINKDINMEIIKENEVFHVNIIGMISEDDIQVKSNYSFIKRDGQYQIINVSNITN